MEWATCPRCLAPQPAYCVLCGATRVVMPEVAGAYRLGGFDAAAEFAGPIDRCRLMTVVERRVVRSPDKADDPYYVPGFEYRMKTWPVDPRPPANAPPTVSTAEARDFCDPAPNIQALMAKFG